MRRRFPAGLAVALALSAVFVIAACDPRHFSASTHSATLLRVANRGVDDVHVYLVRGAAPIRLGTVPGRGSRLFTISPAMLGGGSAVRLRAEAAPGRSAVESAAFSLASGDTVGWEVEASLGITSFRLY